MTLHAGNAAARAERRLAGALIASLALHAALLLLVRTPLEAAPAPPSAPLVARLAPAPVPQPVEPAPPPVIKDTLRPPRTEVLEDYIKPPPRRVITDEPQAQPRTPKPIPPKPLPPKPPIAQRALEPPAAPAATPAPPPSPPAVAAAEPAPRRPLDLSLPQEARARSPERLSTQELNETLTRLSETMLYPSEALRRGLEGEVVIVVELG